MNGDTMIQLNDEIYKKLNLAKIEMGSILKKSFTMDEFLQFLIMRGKYTW